MIEFPEGLEPVEDLGPAAWVQKALKDWPNHPFRVRDLVPPVFDSYARILHETRTEERNGTRTGTWAQRATELGSELGPETAWWQLLGHSEPYEGDRDEWTPDEGRLSEREVGTLTSLLGDNTADAEASWFGLWAGFGFLTPGGVGYLRAPETFRERWAHRMIRRAERKADRAARRAFARHAQFSLLDGGRSYLLIAGTVTDATRFATNPWFQSPTLWWPDDRSWFVHTEIDGMSTYVGGSRRLVDELVGQQILESFEVGADDRAAL